MPPESPLDGPRLPTRPAIGARKLIVPIALFVLAGIPIVAYLWDTLNRLFSGDVDGVRIAIALVAALLFAGLLRILARTVTRWEAQRFD